MADINIRSGGTYTLNELAELARRSLETYEGGISQRRAAKVLNEKFESDRGEWKQPHISAALNDPQRNPGLVRLLVRAFSPYTVDDEPRFRIEREA